MTAAPKRTCNVSKQQRSTMPEQCRGLLDISMPALQKQSRRQILTGCSEVQTCCARVLWTVGGMLRLPNPAWETGPRSRQWDSRRPACRRQRSPDCQAAAERRCPPPPTFAPPPGPAEPPSAPARAPSAGSLHESIWACVRAPRPSSPRPDSMCPEAVKHPEHRRGSLLRTWRSCADSSQSTHEPAMTPPWVLMRG